MYSIQRNSRKKIKKGKKAASPQPHRPRLPPKPHGPFLRAKIIKSYVYLSVILWYPTLQISFALSTVLNSSFFVGYSFPQTFTVYQTLAISLLAVFLVSFLLACPQLYFDIFSCNSKDIFLTYYQMYWIKSGVYNLDFKPLLPGLHDWKTVFGVLGYFKQYFMPYYLQGFISKILTVWQYHNSKRGTVSNTGSTVQNRLFRSTAHVQDCFN